MLRKSIAAILILTVLVAVSAGCVGHFWSIFCELFGLPDAGLPTTVALDANESVGAWMLVTVEGAPDICGRLFGRHTLGHLPPVPADATESLGEAAGWGLAYFYQPDFLTLRASEGEAEERTLDCANVAERITLGPIAAVDTNAKRVLSVSGLHELWREFLWGTLEEHSYRCGDRLEVSVLENYNFQLRVIRNGQVVVERTLAARRIPADCEPLGPITPGETFIYLWWQKVQPDGKTDTYTLVATTDGKFYLGRAGYYWPVPLGGVVEPDELPEVMPEQRVEVPVEDVQQLFDTLEAACAFELPSDLTGGYFYGMPEAGTCWRVSIARGLLANDMFIDQTAISLDERYQAITEALDRFVQEHSGV